VEDLRIISPLSGQGQCTLLCQKGSRRPPACSFSGAQWRHDTTLISYQLSLCADQRPASSCSYRTFFGWCPTRRGNLRESTAAYSLTMSHSLAAQCLRVTGTGTLDDGVALLEQISKASPQRVLMPAHARYCSCSSLCLRILHEVCQ